MSDGSTENPSGEYSLPDILRGFVRSNRRHAVAVVHRDIILEANDVCAKLFGYDEGAQINGMDYPSFLTPESRAAAEEHSVRRQAGRPAPDAWVYDCIRKDGTTFKAEVLVIPWLADPQLALALLRDLSVQQRAIEVLKESERLYRTLADTMPAAIILTDSSGRSIYANDTAAAITGYSVDEILAGAPLLHPEEAEALSLYGQALREHTSGQNYETRFVRKNGAPVWVLVSWEPIVGVLGEMQGLCIVFTDISEHKYARDALRESEARYKGIVENTSDVIMLTRPDGTVAYLSPACSEVLGHEPETLIGQKPWIIHPDDLEHCQAHFQTALQGSTGSQVEYRIVTKAGGTKWVSHSWSPIFDAAEIQMVVSVVRDITEHKQAEETMLKAHADLERAYELQRQFLNNVTHEVRTPLTAVQGYTQLLLEGAVGPVTDDQAALLGKILQSSDHLLEIVGGVLEIARLKSGTIALHPRACTPSAVVEKAVAAILPQATCKGLTVSVDTDKRERMVMLDEEKLIIILTNLLANAVKFTTTGGIEISAGCCEGGLEIIVRDSGMGVAAGRLSSIFDEFEQLDYPGKHKPTGFGMGLAVVANMVEAIGATLTVSSAKGIGTAFTLCVPAIDAV